MISPGEPSSQAFEAFGADFASRERLDGGRGRTWRAGDVVLRPTAGGSEADWRAEVLRDLEHTTEFVPLGQSWHSRGPGWWTGWEALQWVSGAADETQVLDVIRAGAAFHRAVADLPRPPFLDTSDDPWALADRMSWDERPLPTDPMLDRLAAQFRPVLSPSQIIHGDLLGNVLFAEGHHPPRSSTGLPTGAQPASAAPLLWWTHCAGTAPQLRLSPSSARTCLSGHSWWCVL